MFTAALGKLPAEGGSFPTRAGMFPLLFLWLADMGYISRECNADHNSPKPQPGSLTRFMLNSLTGKHQAGGGGNSDPPGSSLSITREAGRRVPGVPGLTEHHHPDNGAAPSPFVKVSLQR